MDPLTLSNPRSNPSHRSRKKHHTQQQLLPIPSFFSLEEALNILSVSVNLPLLDISCKWSHTICDLLCLHLLLSEMFSGFIHIVACVSTLVLIKPIVWVCTTFIHSSIDGYLDYFNFLTIMNNAPMNICAQVFVWTYVLNSLGSGNGCTIR